MMLVKRDFVTFYKQTILGPLWYIIQPIITSIVFTFVFGRLANIPTDGTPQFIFYMCGIVAWNYFAACLNSTSNTFIQNSTIFSKVYFPRAVVPISNVILCTFQFLIHHLSQLAKAHREDTAEVTHKGWVLHGPWGCRCSQCPTRARTSRRERRLALWAATRLGSRS